MSEELLKQFVAKVLLLSTMQQGDGNLFQTCHNDQEQYTANSKKVVL